MSAEGDKEKISTRCPQCGKEVVYEGIDENPHFPFCGKHCKLVDLGKWFEEEHKIEEGIAERMQRGEGPDETKERGG